MHLLLFDGELKVNIDFDHNMNNQNDNFDPLTSVASVPIYHYWSMGKGLKHVD